MSVKRYCKIKSKWAYENKAICVELRKWYIRFVRSDARETQPELLGECKFIIASLPLMISSPSIVTYTQSVSLPSPHHHNLIHVTTMTQYRITSHHGRSPPVLPQHTATAMSPAHRHCNVSLMVTTMWWGPGAPLHTERRHSLNFYHWRTIVRRGRDIFNEN